MRLDKLRLKNVGPYMNAEFTPTAPIAVVYATNGAGKTTLADAAELALSGKIGEGRGGGAAKDMGFEPGPPDYKSGARPRASGTITRGRLSTP